MSTAGTQASDAPALTIFGKAVVVRSLSSDEGKCDVNAADTYEDREQSTSNASGLSDVSEVDSSPTGDSMATPGNGRIPVLSSPIIAPLHSSLAQMCLAEAEVEEDMLPVSLKDLPMHRMRTASDLFEHARHFSGFSNPHIIQRLCRDLIPGWENLSPADINVDQIMAGLSNQLFKVNMREDYPERERFVYPHVLFRIYGKDVDSLYDSRTEIQVFKQLGRRSYAPRLVAEFEVRKNCMRFEPGLLGRPY